MKTGPPPVTREHGSWAFLIVPMMVAIVGADDVTLDSFLFGLAALGVFMSYTPIQSLLRARSAVREMASDMKTHLFWAGAYLFVGGALFLSLLLRGHVLIVLFAAGAVLTFFTHAFLMHRTGKTVWTDLVATCGLTLGTPAMYYVTTGELDDVAGLLWILTVMFFGSTVFYVHMKIERIGLKKSALSWGERLHTGRMNLGYHLVIASLFAVGWMTNVIPPWVIVGIIPMALHAVLGTVRGAPTQRIKTLGYMLVAQSIAYIVLLSLVFNSGSV